MTEFAVLLDVDGPLNPYAAKATQRPEGYETHRMKPRGFEMGKGLRVWLKPSHGAELTALGGELIWATAWEFEANDWIGPHIGLPELPVIDWIDRDPWNEEGLHWKTKRLVQWMNENRPGIPFIWLDDEVGRPDRDFIEENAAPGSRILIISPRIGIAADDYDVITEWKQDLGL